MEQIILFTFLVLFPFGQIIKIGIFNPIDIVVAIGAIYAIYKKFKKPEIFKYFNNFLFILTFSLIFSIATFQTGSLYPILYLIRLFAYFYFLLFIYSYKDKKFLINSLLSLSLISGLFGWFQYFVYPDLRSFFVYGWDDHLFRMAGTFLDPTYLGIILVLGLTIAISKKFRIIALFLLTTIAFTYSRASFLSVFFILIYKRSWVYLLIFLAIILFLPRTAGEGVKLERVSSVNARLENYKQTLEIFKFSPVYGIGFNNICLAKNSDFSSHSCSGADSSLLLILATSGIVGFLSFLHLIIKIWKHSSPILKTSLLAIFIHSFFSNSLFYPWVMGWTIILLGLSLRGKVKS